MVFVDLISCRGRCLTLLMFDNLVITGAQFTKAVEAKQVAQQDAERARFVVLKADQVRFVEVG